MPVFLQTLIFSAYAKILIAIFEKELLKSDTWPYYLGNSFVYLTV